jgi:hypothetical protein
MAAEVLIDIKRRTAMKCPICRSENEMAYSVLSLGFVCLESDCGFELEMDPADARMIMDGVEELVYA